MHGVLQWIRGIFVEIFCSYSLRRPFGEEKRPAKRLFTPEIKRFLKEWLVRRRDNPYPNRDEKKSLAVQTGLTYIQVKTRTSTLQTKFEKYRRDV